MTGLMYYRPEDHVRYLQECLEKLKLEGPDHSAIEWSKFIEQRIRTPLPPIPSSKQNGHSRSGRNSAEKSKSLSFK